VALFLQHYNFQRPHQALGGLVPADRFFRAASPGWARRKAFTVTWLRQGKTLHPIALAPIKGLRSLCKSFQSSRDEWPVP